MPGPPFTVVASGGLPVTQVTDGAPVMTFVEGGGLAVTVVASGGLPFVLEGYATVPAAPAITSSSISGTPEDGQTLTANRTVTGYPSPTITYQWQASGTNISGQTAQTIVLNAATMGLTDAEVISCEITATNTEGSDTVAPTIAFVAAGAGTLDPAITAPVLSLAVGETTYPPELDAALDETVAVGDAILLQWTSDIRFATIDDSASNTIDSGEATAGEAAFTGLSAITTPDVTYFRARVVQPDGDYSAWSSIVLHGEAVDSIPAGFSFTDDVNVALSTVSESDEIPLSGFNQPVTGDAGGDEYAVDEGAGYGSWITTANRTFYPGDKVKVRHTSSASNSTTTDTVLTVGGVSDTYSTSTLAGAVSLPSSGLILRLDADDLSTLYQTVDGTTTPVSGNAQAVGYWGDKSSNTFHMTAAGNDTTRPTYYTNGGLPYVEFDGSNDILRRLAALGLYNNGAMTVVVALRSNAATQAGTNLGLFMEGSSSSANPVYQFGSGGSNDDVAAFIRSDANVTATYTPAGAVLNDGLDATDHVLTFTDNGGSIVSYDDGSGPVTRGYTRGTLTPNRFAIGGWQRAAAGSFLGVKIFAFAAWNRVLTGPEIAEAVTYMGSKQGRSL